MAHPLHGLVLFAHGARDPAWATSFLAVAERVRAARPGTPVALAFLEFMSPDLPAAGASLVAAGCTHVDIVPLFLGGGGHVRRDVPGLVEALHAAHPHCTFRLHPAAGETGRVIDALAAAALDFADTPHASAP
jgi:sirohydrochlorin cobaltochelatase